MYFDGPAYRGGAGEGIWMRSPRIYTLRYSYKLDFDCTNNESKYEVMLLAILDLKKLKVMRVVLCGDSKMVIKQMTSEYQDRHPQMRSCRNGTQDLIEGFKECSFKLIPRV